ncbi:glyoxalase/bleomycin resistance/extradiol dioxygenase family protein [Carnobacterium sp.]|uniref:VOC family protein n=1 Tax=Carnobacterium sp. TaxID=48221 RepID=UPI0028AE988B|nr:glyoxalase/bleomycin resistance/extradiol dioxygenase family protein [Carnobacterium sp.]
MAPQVKSIFINLPVEDLTKSVDFFSRLGYTDENASCLILKEGVFVTLILKDYFKSYTGKEVPDAATETEVMVTLVAAKKNLIIEFLEKALALGATEQKVENTEKYIYYRRFTDLDGHLWELLYYDASEMIYQ